MSKIDKKNQSINNPEDKAQNEANKPKNSSFGYSVKLSSSESSDTASKKPPKDQKKMTPEQLAAMKAEFLKNLKNNPAARAQMQQHVKAEFKKLPWFKRSIKYVSFFSLQKIQNLIVESLKNIDSLINFVVKKHDSNRNEVLQKARPPILFGMWVAIVTFCIFGVWAGLAPLDSASSGMGIVVVDSSRKIIQHKEGGIVEEIYVQDGEHVKKNQPLVKLSNANIKPQLDIYLNKELHYKAWLARLKAEKNNSNQINFGDNLINNIHDSEINKIIMNQQSLFETRQEELQGKLSGIDKRIDQHRQEILAAEAQKISTETQLKLVKEQVAVLTDLYEKGLAQKPRLIEQQSREAQLIAAVSELNSKIIRIKQSITELNIEKNNVKNHYLSEINREIRDVNEKLNETHEHIKTIQDQFGRLLITSPIDGIVSKVQTSTIGGVIHPGSSVMTIIPKDDNLVIDAFIKPQDIDSVYVGLKAKVRISAFKSRSTGPLDGTVVYVSPDLTEPSENDKLYNMIFQQYLQNQPAFKVRIKVDKEQLKKISKYRDYELYPGMQADIMIVTGERTLLQYLLDPITTTFWHAFIEK